MKPTLTTRFTKRSNVKNCDQVNGPKRPSIWPESGYFDAHFFMEGKNTHLGHPPGIWSENTIIIPKDLCEPSKIYVNSI